MSCLPRANFQFVIISICSFTPGKSTNTTIVCAKETHPRNKILFQRLEKIKFSRLSNFSQENYFFPSEIIHYQIKVKVRLSIKKFYTKANPCVAPVVHHSILMYSVLTQQQTSRHFYCFVFNDLRLCLKPKLSDSISVVIFFPPPRKKIK